MYACKYYILNIFKKKMCAWKTSRYETCVQNSSYYFPHFKKKLLTMDAIAVYPKAASMSQFVHLYYV